MTCERRALLGLLGEVASSAMPDGPRRRPKLRAPFTNALLDAASKRHSFRRRQQSEGWTIPGFARARAKADFRLPRDGRLRQ